MFFKMFIYSRYKSSWAPCILSDNPGFIHVVASGSSAHVCIASKSLFDDCFTCWHQLPDGYLGGFQLGAARNKATPSILVLTFWRRAFISTQEWTPGS